MPFTSTFPALLTGDMAGLIVDGIGLISDKVENSGYN
jgi:hypothetical protein